MNQRTHFTRRRFLEGTGIALTLPLMESELTGADAKIEGDPRRLVCIANHLGYYPGNFFPQDAGRGYQISPTLQPVQRHRDEFTVFSNLDDGITGGHKGVQAFLSGIRKDESNGFPDKNMTIDQVAAEHVGSGTRFPSITAGLGLGTDLCWTRSGVRIPPVNNPARLFEALFVQSDESSLGKERTRLTRRASVLDALRETARELDQEISAADRQKLDQYLTSVRDVERRLQMSQAWLDKPKPASPIDPVADQERMHIEEIPLFYELLTLALQADLTRVATFEIPMGFRTSELEVGSYHGLSHHSKSAERLGQLQIVETYLMKQFAHFIDRMKEAQVFEHTAIVWGSGMGNGSSHSNRNLPVILAGGGMKHQGHVVCPAEDHKRVPLSNLWLSTLQWFGVETDRFGKSTGTFSPMNLA
ncbi:DUF1552 domain-containing protein [Rubripirellula sp.]|nr:DUF1552 domain-containing protein [Planctomycetaceae bacterium]MDA9858817.1 DUF1552 domain-containing protein [Rubripirellula sp.]